MIKLMRLAYIHMSFVYAGGGEKLVIKQVEWLRKQGLQVDCFSPVVWQNNCFPDLIGKIKVKEILPGFSWLYRKLQVNTMIYFLAFLAPILAFRWRRYDVIIADHQPSSWFAFMVWKLFRVPYVLYLAQPNRMLYQREIDQEVGLRLVHTLRLSKFLGWLFKPLMFLLDRQIVKDAAAVMTNGEHSQRVVETIYGRKTTNCPAGVEWKKLKGQKKLTKKSYILLTNRHVPQKKFEWAIELMKSLRKEYGNVKLIITGGETDYTEKLKELVRKWQLEKVVRFTGYLTETELFKLYQQASIYIYTAPEEDFGMGVTEAMAAGLPVVAWKAGGPAYILKDKQTGFLVEPYQVSEMGRAVSRLIKDKALRLRLGQAGQVEAKRYSWGKHGQCLEKCLIKAIRMAD